MKIEIIIQNSDVEKENFVDKVENYIDKVENCVK